VTGENHAERDSEVVSFVVTNARPVGRMRNLFALVDVEIQIAGVTFTIVGVQARRLAGGGTSVELPTVKDESGAWRSAIRLPQELYEPLADAVMEFLVDAGLARRRFTTVA
jgi:hypothetical protein